MHALPLALAFDEIALGRTLDGMTDRELDDLDFGLIGFDAAGIVRRYNRHESDAAGLSASRVLGRALFTEVAPCMNNFLVAQRFEDALRAGRGLDETVDYVLTLRMKPVRVVLRLLASTDGERAWVVIRRSVTGRP